MEITVFNGSPRGRTSNTSRIVEPLLEGAREAGAEVRQVFLVEKNIGHCTGCFSCWGATPGECVLKDDMKDLMNLFIESDFVGLGTPVYGMLMTALLKNFTDRLLPLGTPHIRKNPDGTFYHNGRIGRFPRLFVVANSGFPGQLNFEMLKAYYQPQKPVFEIYRNCGEILANPEIADSEATRMIQQFYQALKQAGYHLATDGRVPDDVLKTIQQDLISDDAYMAGANQFWDSEMGKQAE